MLLTTHVSTTLLICQGLSNPWLAFLIGLITHYLLDIIPHGDRIKENRYLIDDIKYHKKYPGEFKRYKIIAPVDVAIAALLAGYLYLSGQILHPEIIIPGILGAVLPDAIHGLNLIMKSKIITKINRFHMQMHAFVSDISWEWALAGQIIYNVLVLYILYFSRFGINI